MTTDALPGIPGSTDTGWIPPEDLSRDEYLANVKAAKRIRGAIPFVIGDLLIHGEDKMGEDHYQAFSEVDYTDKVIKRIVKVCRAYPHEERRPKVSFWQHEMLLTGRITDHKREEIFEEIENTEDGMTDVRVGEKIRGAEQGEHGEPAYTDEDYCPACGALSTYWEKPPTEFYEPSEAAKDISHLRAV